jgi:hypothetical protein
VATPAVVVEVVAALAVTASKEHILPQIIILLAQQFIVLQAVAVAAAAVAVVVVHRAMLVGMDHLEILGITEVEVIAELPVTEQHLLTIQALVHQIHGPDHQPQFHGRAEQAEIRLRLFIMVRHQILQVVQTMQSL